MLTVVLDKVNWFLDFHGFESELLFMEAVVNNGTGLPQP